MAKVSFTNLKLKMNKEIKEILEDNFDTEIYIVGIEF